VRLINIPVLTVGSEEDIGDWRKSDNKNTKNVKRYKDNTSK
jgi:hypothetical protein